MSKSIGSQTNFSGGISFSDDTGIENSVSFLRNVDHRTDPGHLTLNPRSEKDSGSIVTDLPMWGTRACDRIFSYGNTGNIYIKEDDSWSLAHTASDSTGNGMEYFAQDKALYYAQNKTLGRLLNACTGVSYTNDFLGAAGGDPTNTNSCDFEASSSQYASRADTASLSITSDLTIEAYAKPESLPTTGNTMTLVSKWDENGNNRSYKMDLATESSFFGDGSDGSLTISSNTTETVIDANCTGTSGSKSLTISNVTGTFSTGDKLLIIQMRGTGVGAYQLNEVQSKSGSVITLKNSLNFTPRHSATASVANKAQVRVLKQYTTVTVNSSRHYYVKDWDGLKGGVIGWYSSGTTTLNGYVNADGSTGAVTSTLNSTASLTTGAGFRGGGGCRGSHWVRAACGEGHVGASFSSIFDDDDGYPRPQDGNGSGGGGANFTNGWISRSGGGGGHGANGVNGTQTTTAGTTSGSSNLTTMTMGGGGGGGGKGDGDGGGDNAGSGGSGGAIVAIFAQDLVINSSTGYILSRGGTGGAGLGSDRGAGAGGGAGGSILIKTQTASIGTNRIRATGGVGGAGEGGAGGKGRIHMDYYTSISGTSNPASTLSKDTSLGSVDGYVLRLLVSDDGSDNEILRTSIDISTNSWARWQASWDASAKKASFYKNGVLVGSYTGSMTSIDDNTSKGAIACDFNSSAQNFFDGIIDDVRIWNDIRSTSELVGWNNKVLAGTEANLVAYWKLDEDYTDSQSSGNNDLTASNSPTFSVDVPFNGLTTRNDQDQANDQTGNTYSLTTAIDEGATHRQTFIPEKDPQESIELDIAAIGTGDWTLTIHDQLNNEIATITVENGDLNTGIYEFIFDSVWRPIIGASYHFHLTSTVADGTVVTGTASDLETVRFWSHYQFLVNDEYHPMANFIDFMCIGNERYLAKLDAGDSYNPHRLTFPAEYRVRSLGYWREFIAIGCWKGESITDYDDGRVFFWDGVSDTYNHQIPIPEGGVNALFGTKDVLFIVAGYTGEVLVYSGGGAAQKLNKIPNIGRKENIEIAPGSINMWRSLVHFGSDLSTDSESVYKGVYTIGTTNRIYPTSLGFDFNTSLGDQTNSDVSIGMIYPSGQNLYVGWKNLNAYGIDKVSVTNDVFTDGTIESLISDMGSISKEQYPLVLRADFKPLLDGESIRVKYKADRESEWKVSEYEDTEGAKDIRLRIPERMKEIQVACDLTTTVSTSPTLLGITIESEMEDRSRLNA